MDLVALEVGASLSIMGTVKNYKVPEEEYLAPEAIVMQMNYEGVICSSNEMLDETEGEW